MQQVDQFESDQFLQLLTDALRAGPGSPQWHEAVAHLKSAGNGEADEYKMILTAREHLAAGRDYRSIKAGPGFTKRVMQSIESESANPRGMPTANLFAILGAVGILAVVAVIAIVLSRTTPTQTTAADLENTSFLTQVVRADFSQDIAMEWIKFGQSPTLSTAQQSLRAGYQPGNDNQYKNGGIYLAKALVPEYPFALEANLKLRKPSTSVRLQLFITEDPDFKESPIGPFVVELANGQLSVFLPDNKLSGQQLTLPASTTTAHILIKLDSKFAVVESEGKRLYSGPSGLPEKPGYPGLKFISKGPEKDLEDVTVQSIRILKP